LESDVTELQGSGDVGRQLLLGKKLLERGFLTPDQLREALTERAQSLSQGTPRPLAAILLQKGFVTENQLRIALDETSGQASSPRVSSPSAASPPVLTPPVSPAPERLGKYELLRELGRGGMGVVYEARDADLGRKVALKLMITPAGADPKEVAHDEERFVQEAQLTAKLKHPNIVTVYEAGILDGRRFIAMELVEGLPFSQWRKQGGVSLKQQVAVLRDVALAVHHAHEQGVLHRDLKPRNVLVSPDGHAYVTDFGLAKPLGTKVHASLTGSGAVVGTPAYMSPEQAQSGHRVDWRTDIWSLGVMLYEILTDRTPFTGESPLEILMKVVKDDVVPPSRAASGAAARQIDKAIENVCLKALAKRDRDRYPTARAFAEDLTRWLSGQEVRTVAPKPARKPSYLRAAVLGAALGVAAVGGLMLAVSVRRPSVAAELAEARRHMDEENYTEALIAFTRALAKDPEHAEAIEGERRAREALRKKSLEREQQLRAALESARGDAERARREAEEKARAEERALSPEEREALAAQRAAAEERARRAEEEARRADEQLRLTRSGPAARPSPGTVPADDAWKDAVNLLGLVELPRNVVSGTWTWREGALASGREPFARVEIPYVPPEEYDLRVVFRRKAGTDAVALILGARGGTPVVWALGAAGNTSLALRPPPVEGPPAVGPPVLENDRPYTAVIQVRRRRVRALLEGRLVEEREGSLEDPASDPAWRLRGDAVLGLGSHESPVVFQRVDLLEVTGRGRRAVSAPMPVFVPPARSGAPLRPGLVGEYYYGADFEVLALRRVDPAVSFEWGEGPPWPGGPKDAFSVRWRGYLHAPRPGRYTFSVEADDGVRVRLDGRQILSSWGLHAEPPKPVACVLEEGYHRLEVDYYDRAYRASIAVQWAEGSGGAAAPIGARSLFHDPSEFQPLPAQRVPELISALAGHSNVVTGVAFAPDASFAATSGEDRRVRIWDPVTRREASSLGATPSGLLAVAVSPDGRYVAAAGADGRVRVWEGGRGPEIRVLDGHAGHASVLAFHPSGRLLASGGYDRKIRLWEVDGWKLRGEMEGHGGSVDGLAFSPDGTMLASGGADRRVRVWDVESGRERKVLDGHADGVTACAFSPDGTLIASAGRDTLVKLWDPETGRELRRLRGHTGEALCLAFSPDGRLLASGGADAMVRLWDPATGKEVRILPGHGDRVTGVAFSRVGALLASVGSDTSVRLWDVKSW
jgi:predicted Ser/Thr protein kinase/tetratricopeptide (TPR) repeat protein